MKIDLRTFNFRNRIIFKKIKSHIFWIYFLDNIIVHIFWTIVHSGTEVMSLTLRGLHNLYGNFLFNVSTYSTGCLFVTIFLHCL